MNKDICIILVGPESCGNIGAAARAMKNMGLNDLRLVRPPVDWKEKAEKLAMSAYDVVKAAGVFHSLDRALYDRNFVLGTSRRSGARRGSWMDFDQAIQKVSSGKYRSAVVFGKESKGLANRDLALCDWITTIPSHPEYPSLNLAQAVMVVCYEALRHVKRHPEPFGRHPERSRPQDRLREGSRDPSATSQPQDDVWTPDFLPKSEIAQALKAFSVVLKSLGYYDDVATRILTTFSGLIKRNGLMESEAQLIKGLSRRIVERTRN